MMRPAAGIAMALTLVLLGACEREHRSFNTPPHVAAAASVPSAGGLYPGPSASTASAPAAAMPSQAVSVVVPMVRVDDRYEANAFLVNQGKRLFRWYNCNGCHGNGGGNIGPALMDHKWVYGSAPAQIAATILQGRPNGMPAFAGRIPEDQVWQLVAYVRSMSGQLRIDVAPSRSDSLSAGPPEARREKERPQNVAPH